MLLTNFLESSFFGGSSLEAGTIFPPFLAEDSAVLPCVAFLVVLASPKMTLSSTSSLFEANGTFDFLVLAPWLPFLGMLGIGVPIQCCMVLIPRIEGVELRQAVNQWRSFDENTGYFPSRNQSSRRAAILKKFPKIRVV